ncbi:hypothetical protein NUW54_g883 [Trametes sanguinea]|uniref:Uncharacterized protein n=1 Tax=Trametes sanguinea TaxID=158606 RepID=A0ACC1Q7Y0_9APHY|nr:hypothetical protein NUW54_g883 [Trametes sanguinea]
MKMIGLREPNGWEGRLLLFSFAHPNASIVCPTMLTMPASVHVFQIPELIHIIGQFCCPEWHYYNHGEVLPLYDLRQALAIWTVSKTFLQHFVRPFPRTALSVSAVERLTQLFKNVIEYERKWCRCPLSDGNSNHPHVNFLNLYLLEVEIQNKSLNNLDLWMLATLHLKNTCHYGPGTQGVAQLLGPSPWDNHLSFVSTLEAFHHLQTLLINTPAFPYPVPHNINQEAFQNAIELGAFLSIYNFLPHEWLAYRKAAAVLPHLCRYYLQYLDWDALLLIWEDAQVLTMGQNELDHYDGQVHDLDHSQPMLALISQILDGPTALPLMKSQPALLNGLDILRMDPKTGKAIQKDVDAVKIIDKSYLSKSFKAKIKEAQQLIDDIVEHFSLNEKKERAL